MSFETCRKIIGIGRNYAKHAIELGNPIPQKPLLFLKPPSSIIQTGSIEIPKGCQVHHELELGVVIGKKGRNISKLNAESYIKGYVLGLDMTARNIQDEAKKAGNPWTVAKGYDTFTPIGEFIAKQKIPDPVNLDLELKSIHDKVIQKGNTKDMLFNIPHLIEYVSSIMTLEDGDLILTGTPEGVGPVKKGDVLVGTLKSKDQIISQIKFNVVDRQ